MASLRLGSVCGKICITNLCCRGICGIYEEEQRESQELVLDAKVAYDCSECIASDSISCSVDYAVVAREAQDFVAKHSFNLLESFVAALCDHLLRKFPRMKRLSLCMRKHPRSWPDGRTEFSASLSKSRSLAILGLGSNLGDRAALLSDAERRIRQLLDVKVLRTSATHHTAPLICEKQPAFLNRSLLLETILNPLELLMATQCIENDLGRIRPGNYGPRTMDIDLLLFEGVRSASKALTLPHPQLSRRRFWLEELEELGLYLEAKDESVWLQECRAV
ncbi:MAG: 2-amino-4-hydroxy-6-hydroxymethyldihydropteridine diphosphokinase [Puniceicoccales bacterium]|nr:2-amino-4-hydroxy-6-hydroxymethyldihydropteridine diphosphokinase [Puniceicoccales bacterium]